MFVLGPGVKAGLYGAYPALTNLDSGDLRYTTDFRRVYATVLDQWLNADSTKVLNNRFEPVGFFGRAGNEVAARPSTQPSSSDEPANDMMMGGGMMKK
jgi:hypothetical protein